MIPLIVFVDFINQTYRYKATAAERHGRSCPPKLGHTARKMIILQKYTHTPYGVSKEKPQGVSRFRTIKIEQPADCCVVSKTRTFFPRFFSKRMRIFFSKFVLVAPKRWSEEMQQNIVFSGAPKVSYTDLDSFDTRRGNKNEKNGVDHKTNHEVKLSGTGLINCDGQERGK